MTASEADRESAILLALGGLLHREIAIDELLERIVGHIMGALRADRGTLYLLDRGSGELVSRAAHLPELQEIRLQVGQGIAGWVAATGEVVNVPTTPTEARLDDRFDRETGYRTESVLAAPIRDRAQRILGVVQLLNRRDGSFSTSDAAALESLATQAGLVLEATTIHAELSRAPGGAMEPRPLVGQLNRVVGSSPLLRRASRLTQKVAATDATVLIRGESGTGKELFARAVHVNSARSDRPFVKVDCAALPESLIENELFGHERGAFTGAERAAHGLLDAAQSGTLFLDELGELPLPVQGKLLRVLQDREYLRVGGTEPVKADVRVVAATNRDLARMVEEGRFRADLFYRVKVVEILLPPLRARGPEDLERLARHFAERLARRHGVKARALSPAALERLVTYAWPGNVRELENCLESAVIIAEGDRIEPEDLPLPERDPVVPPVVAVAPASAPSMPARPASHETLAEVERRHILAVLAEVGGNRSLAARRLGIGRNTLARKLRGEPEVEAP